MMQANLLFLPIHLSASQPALAICLTISLITTDFISIISANYPLHPAYPKISRHWWQMTDDCKSKISFSHESDSSWNLQILQNIYISSNQHLTHGNIVNRIITSSFLIILQTFRVDLQRHVSLEIDDTYHLNLSQYTVSVYMFSSWVMCVYCTK